MASILARQFPAGNTYTLDGNQWRESRTALSNLPEATRRQFQLVQGHGPFGLHEYLPQPAHYFTLIRNPVARVLSTYNYIYENKAHFLHEHVAKTGMSLTDYVVGQVNRMTDNGQVRLLAGVDKQVSYGQCTNELLEKAISNLQTQFLAVGVTEQFDLSLLTLSTWLGWRGFPFYRRKNTTRKRHSAPDEVAKARALIEKHNQFDLALHNFAKQRLLADAQSVSKTKLALFSWLNPLYGKAIASYQRMRKQ